MLPMGPRDSSRRDPQFSAPGLCRRNRDDASATRYPKKAITASVSRRKRRRTIRTPPKESRCYATNCNGNSSCGHFDTLRHPSLRSRSLSEIAARHWLHQMLAIRVGFRESMRDEGIHVVTKSIRGRFDVKMKPQPAQEEAAGAVIGRMLLDKRYHGALDAIGQGQMLAAHGSEKGSAGYVAIELVSGTLDGRAGSFVLQHTGIMDRGAPQLSIVVVPDSGTEALHGLIGRMDIVIASGEHTYVFDYSLPD